MPIPLGVLAVAGAGAAPSGPGVYELLETQVLGSNQADVTFSNLNTNYGSTYQHLQIRASVSFVDYSDYMTLRMNGDSNANYASFGLYGNGTSVVAASINDNTTQQSQIYTAVAPASSTQFTALVVELLDAFETTKFKTARGLGGSGNSTQYITLSSGLWRNTAALTSIRFGIPGNGTSIRASSRFSLYGIRSVNP
jgi:hypothetical protein